MDRVKFSIWKQAIFLEIKDIKDLSGSVVFLLCTINSAD